MVEIIHHCFLLFLIGKIFNKLDIVYIILLFFMTLSEISIIIPDIYKLINYLLINQLIK